MNITTKYFTIRTWSTNGLMYEYGKTKPAYHKHLLLIIGNKKYKFTREY